MKPRIALALIAGLVLAWAAGSVGAQTTTTEDRQVPTATTVTKTVTQPAQTVTATRTATVTTEAAAPTAVVQVAPTTGNGNPSTEPSDDPLSTVAWIVIGLGILLVAVGIYQLGRHRHDSPPPPAAPAA
jgi:hypothetical protein